MTNGATQVVLVLQVVEVTTYRLYDSRNPAFNVFRLEESANLVGVILGG